MDTLILLMFLVGCFVTPLLGFKTLSTRESRSEGWFAFSLLITVALGNYLA